jgi:acetyl esterase/lipase
MMASSCRLALLFAALPAVALCQPPRITTDIEFAHIGEHSLKLDLYVPAQPARPSLVVWVHGGAWRGGSKNNPSIRPLTERGFAVASIDYRLSPVAKFPTQIHDIKAAIRYLRAHADKYGLATEKIAISGGSAGGHLAALAGMTSGIKELEGEIGDHRDQSSNVQAIVVFYGAANLTTILSQSTPHGLSVRAPALDLLLGGPPDAKADLARLASPVFHTDRSDPPLLWFHGDQDPQMPINQAHEMSGAYKKAGIPATLDVVHGGVHGGKLFFTPEQLDQTAAFLSTALKGGPRAQGGTP